MNNPYEILGIPENATEAQIKKAFRQKAKETHPDLHPNDKNATEKFRAVVEAYNFLINKEADGLYCNQQYSGANEWHEFNPDEVRVYISMMLMQFKPYQSAAKKALFRGLAWFVGGLLVTLMTITTGSGIIAYGAILVGGYETVKGCTAYYKINSALKNMENELWEKFMGPGAASKYASRKFDEGRTSTETHQHDSKRETATETPAEEKGNKTKGKTINKKVAVVFGVIAIAFFAMIIWLSTSKVYTLSCGDSMTIRVGDKKNISVEGVSGDCVNWSFDDEIIKIENGKIIGLDEGSCTIIANVRKGLSHGYGTANIEVKYREMQIGDNEQLDVEIGESITIPVTNKKGEKINPSKVEWKFCDSYYGSFDENKDEMELSDTSQYAYIESGKIKGLKQGTVALQGTYKDGLKVWRGYCSVTSDYKVIDYYDGQILVGKSGNIPVKINTSQSVYVYLKNISGGNDFAFLVQGLDFYLKEDGSFGSGSSTTVYAPAGKYEFYYACGDEWRGKEHFFGRDTIFNKEDTPIELSVSGNIANGIEITLYNGKLYTIGKVISGNITEEDFPK